MLNTKPLIIGQMRGDPELIFFIWISFLKRTLMHSKFERVNLTRIFIYVY